MNVSKVSEFHASRIFKSLDSAFKGLREEKAKKISAHCNSCYQFNVINNSGETESWTINLKNDRPQVINGRSSQNPNAIIALNDELLLALFEGRANAHRCLLEGKIKVKGHVMLAPKLDYLFKQVRPSSRL